MLSYVLRDAEAIITMPKTQRIQSVTPLLLAAVLLFAAACAGADETTTRSDAALRNDFYLESILPALNHVESVAPQGVGDAAVQPPDLNTYDLNMNAGDLLSLRRNFTRGVIDRATSPLGVAFQEKLGTEAGLDLGRTALSFSSTTTRIQDLRGMALDTKRVDVMGLKQSFGGGDSSSTLSLTRTVTEQITTASAFTSTVEALNFHSGLTSSTDLMLRASRTSSDKPRALQETDFQATLKIGFSGGEGPINYQRTHKFNASTDIVAERMDFVLPLALSSGKALAEYHSAFTTTNGKEVGQRTTHVAIPLRLTGQAGLLDHSIVGQDKGQGMLETTTTKLLVPLRIAGNVFTTEETRILTSLSGNETETLTSKLVAPLAGGQATVQHQTVKNTTAAGAVAETEQIALTLPSIKLGDRMSFTGKRVTTDKLGVSDQEVTNVSLVADPLKPLHLEAQYMVDDRGDTKVTTSRQLHTRWAISDKSALLGRFSEAETAAAATPNVLRLVEFVRDRGTSDVGIRAGIASYEVPGATVDNARRLEIVAGAPKTIELNAAYSEYDTKSYARLPEDGTMAVSLQHGDPGSFAVRLRYEDQPTRIEPLQAIDLAMKALGGSLQMSYANNPLGPDGKLVRQAAQYEATLKRRIMGDVNLELGYRYLDYEQGEGEDQNLRIKLDGGREDAAGKLALAFFSGDFTPAVKGSVTPGSMLDLSYTRKWGDDGRISLILKHSTAPTATLGQDNTEGRLEFNTCF